MEPVGEVLLGGSCNLFKSADAPKILLLGNGKVHFDRIDLGKLGENSGSSGGADQIADLAWRYARDSVKRRA